MASLFGSWGSDPFGELVEKATSELLPAGQEDIALNLEICDQVRSKQVPAKQAMQTIKRRLSHKNPNVILLALGLTDICIKNGGDHFLAEVASREFMDNLESILRSPSGINFDVKTKALKLLQNWAQISESKPLQMGYITDTYKSLKSSGFEFPAPDPSNLVSAALVETLTAPEWTDGDVCMRCRTAFTTFNRKHHCRNCGNVYCQDCSSKTMALPWFGVGQDVRVCESCYSKRGPPKVVADKTKPSRSKSTNVLPSGRGGVGSHQRSNTLGAGSSRTSRSSARKKEEDDLALAIKLSLESSGSVPSKSSYDVSQPPVREGRPTKQADGRMMEGTDADDDPDLAAAIAASLREYAPPQPSAPDDDGRTTPRANVQPSSFDGSKMPLPPSLELPASDVDAILTFSQDAFAQEMHFRQNRRWQANPGQQQQLQAGYERATTARPRMAKTLDEATRRHGVLVSMHDKLSEAVRLYDRLLDAQMSRPTYGTYAQQNAPPQADYYTQTAENRYSADPNIQSHQYLNHPSMQAAHGQGQASSSLYPVPPLHQSLQAPSAPYGLQDSSHDSSVQSSSLSYIGPESPSPYHGPTQQYISYDASRDPNQAYNQRREQDYAGALNSGRSEQTLHAGPLSPNLPNGSSDARSMYNPSANSFNGYNGPTYGSTNDVSANYNGHQTYHENEQPLSNNVYQSPSQVIRQVNPNEPQQAPYLGGLNQNLASMTISAPPLESPSMYETGVDPNYALQQNVPMSQKVAPPFVVEQQQQQPQQYSTDVNVPNYQQQRAPYEIIQQPTAPRNDVEISSEWRTIPIADSSAGASIIASAPHPPIGRIDDSNVNIPVLPSAPITSPSSNMKHAIPAGFDDLASPTSPTGTGKQSQQQQQPWNRPMETALIDL